jgi:hypothetical protein
LNKDVRSLFGYDSPNEKYDQLLNIYRRGGRTEPLEIYAVMNNTEP